MSEAVRQLTPVEVARAEIMRFMEENDLFLSDEMSGKFNEIFDYTLKYESEHNHMEEKRFYETADRIVEENKLLKTQVRILTKYIEEHNI